MLGMTAFRTESFKYLVFPGKKMADQAADIEMAMGPPPAPPKRGGLFGGGLKLELGGKKPEAGTPAAEFQSMGQEVNNVSRRLRLLEDRTQNLRQKVQLTDQNMLDNQRKLLTEIKTNADDIAEMKHQIQEVENKIVMLIKELRMCANKEDVDIMSKYLEFWQPQTFVTREQVEKIIQEMLHNYTQ